MSKIETNYTRSKSSTFLLLFIAVTFFMCNEGFDLKTLHVSEQYRTLTIIGLIMILLFLVIRIVVVNKKRLYKNLYFWYLVGIILTALLPTFWNLTVINRLNFIEVLRSILNYGGLLIFVILITYKRDISFVYKLNTLITVMITFNIIFLIILSGFQIEASHLIVDTAIDSRFDRLRLSLGWGLRNAAVYAYFYSLVIITTKSILLRRRIFNLISIFAYLWYFFMVSMSRRVIIGVIIITAIYLLFYLSTKVKIYIITLLIFLSAIIYAMPQFSVISETIQLSYATIMEESQQGEGSMGIRQEGALYYLNLFKDSHYVGIGLLSNRLPENNEYVMGLVEKSYNPVDHGMISVLYMFGFQGILLMIIMIIKIFMDMREVQHNGFANSSVIAICIQLYVMFCIFSITDMFWKPDESIWVGILLYLIWRLRDENYPSYNMKIITYNESNVKDNKKIGIIKND